MSTNVILPKFKVPGEPPRWALRALAATGASVVVSLVVLGGVVASRNSVDAKALQANVRNVGGTETATASTAPAPAVAAAPVPAPSAPESAVAALPASDEPAVSDGARKLASRKHHGKTRHAGRGSRGHGKVAVAASQPAASPAKKKPGSMSNDELDKLLGLK